VKIACLSHTVLSRGYGTERAVVGLSRGLTALGHDVTLISIAPGKADARSTGFADSLATTPFAQVHVADPDGGLFGSFFARRALHRALQAGHFDVVHAHVPFPMGLWAAEAATRGGAPLVITCHRPLMKPETERWLNGESVRRKTARRCRQRAAALREAAACIAISGSMAREIARFRGRSEGIHQIPNGVELEDYAGDGALTAGERALIGEPLLRRPFVLALGRLVREKGIDVLLRALARARATDLDVVLAGDGGEQPALEALARELGVASRVHFLGYVDGARKRALLRGAIGLACPSTWAEPFGLVLLEAFASGRAVIGSRIGGIGEVVAHERTGLLCAPGDVDGLAAALDVLALEPARRAALERGATEEARRYSWVDIARRHVEVYEAVAGAATAV
jgi:glycogen(starch) synthase